MTNDEGSRGVTQLVGIGVLLAVIGVGFMVWKVQGLTTEIHAWADQAEREKMEANYMEGSWRSGGVLITVRTYEEPGQTPAQFAEAHAARVAAAKAQFPKDP